MRVAATAACLDLTDVIAAQCDGATVKNRDEGGAERWVDTVKEHEADDKEAAARFP